jgi:hypothetical protein
MRDFIGASIGTDDLSELEETATHNSTGTQGVNGPSELFLVKRKLGILGIVCGTLEFGCD